MKLISILILCALFGCNSYDKQPNEQIVSKRIIVEKDSIPAHWEFVASGQVAPQAYIPTLYFFVLSKNLNNLDSFDNIALRVTKSKFYTEKVGDTIIISN